MHNRLSYSKVSLWEQCKYAWKCKYIYRTPKSGKAFPLSFGSAQHDTMEGVYGHHMREELVGKLDVDLGLELWKDAWNRYMDGIGTSEAFDRGWTMLRRAIQEEGVVSHWDILGVEYPFEFMAGDYPVIGFIDRVDRDGQGLEIVDYKTNWHLFPPWEVDSSLQMTVYDIAARRIWPWAEEVQLTFHMLKHGVKLHTKRTEEQRKAGLAYLETVGKAMDSERDFPPTLNMYCAFCDYHHACPEYRKAVLEGETFAEPENLEDISRERERLAFVEKAAGSRVKALDRTLLEALRDEDELRVNGRTYQVYEVASLSYPTVATAKVLAERLGKPVAEVVDLISSVDNTKLSKVLDQVAGEKERILMKMDLDLLAQKRYYPRVWSKETK